jgi:hypothetical protein
LRVRGNHRDVVCRDALPDWPGRMSVRANAQDEPNEAEERDVEA